MERETTTLVAEHINAPYAGHIIYDPDHWPPFTAKIRIDANNQPIVRFVIHELMHFMFSTLFAGYMDDTLDEVCIVALDNYLYEYVKKSKTRLGKWNTLIEKKLAESEAKLKTVPLEEQVDRS